MERHSEAAFETVIEALTASFKARGVGGLGRSHRKNYRQIARTLPTPGFRHTSGASRLPAGIRQTLSAEPGPALSTGASVTGHLDVAESIRHV